MDEKDKAHKLCHSSFSGFPSVRPHSPCRNHTRYFNINLAIEFLTSRSIYQIGVQDRLWLKVPLNFGQALPGAL